MTSKQNVLVVEDDALQMMASGDLVEDAGFAPLYASNADEALELLNEPARFLSGTLGSTLASRRQFFDFLPASCGICSFPGWFCRYEIVLHL